MRAVSVPTDLETVPDDEDDEGKDTPEKDFSRPRTATGRTLSYTKSNGEFDEAESVGGSGRRRPASVQIYGSNVGNTTFGQDGGREEALAKLMGQSGSQRQRTASPGSTMSRRNSLMKPGVSYRVRPKRVSMTSTGRVSVASARSDGTGIFDPPALVKHDRYTSSSTDGELITPLPSMDKIDKAIGAEEILHASLSGGEDDDCEKDGETADDRRAADKRMSTISTTTVTFGQ
jgi:hypothetical protein